MFYGVMFRLLFRLFHLFRLFRHVLGRPILRPRVIRGHSALANDRPEFRGHSTGDIFKRIS